MAIAKKYMGLCASSRFVLPGEGGGERCILHKCAEENMCIYAEYTILISYCFGNGCFCRRRKGKFLVCLCQINIFWYIKQRYFPLV